MQILKLLGIIWVVLELIVFVLVAKVVGLTAAILLVILSMIIGSGMMRSEGYHILRQTREDMMDGKSPAGGMLESLSVALGGFLMIIPGFITSFIGILLLIPGIRRSILQSFIDLKFKSPNEPTFDDTPENTPQHGRTIDGEFKKGED